MSIVTPIKAPWMVSSTERELALDEPGDNTLKVGFLGFYGKDFINGEIIDRYEDVEVTFNRVSDFRYFPDYSPEDAERIDSYDWAPVPEYRDDTGSLVHHGEKFHEIWKESGFCPDPAIYEIKDSEWVGSVKGNEKLKHYLVLGGDYNLEVLAVEFGFS